MNIVHYPHGALRVKTKPVQTIDPDVIRSAHEMIDLMYRHEGLGLAAPQVALDMRLIVMNFVGDPERKDQEVIAINPVILESHGQVKDREGCLSFPGLYQDIRRAEKVKVQAYNLQGELFEMTCEGLAARVWQHEIDHLNGVLFIDLMGTVARMSSRRHLENYLYEFDQAVKKGSLPANTPRKL